MKDLAKKILKQNNINWIPDNYISSVTEENKVYSIYLNSGGVLKLKKQ